MRSVWVFRAFQVYTAAGSRPKHQAHQALNFGSSADSFHIHYVFLPFLVLTPPKKGMAIHCAPTTDASRTMAQEARRPCAADISAPRKALKLRLSVSPGSVHPVPSRFPEAPVTVGSVVVPRLPERGWSASEWAGGVIWSVATERKQVSKPCATFEAGVGSKHQQAVCAEC